MIYVPNDSVRAGRIDGNDFDTHSRHCLHGSWRRVGSGSQPRTNVPASRLASDDDPVSPSCLVEPSQVEVVATLPIGRWASSRGCKIEARGNTGAVTLPTVTRAARNQGEQIPLDVI